MLSGLVFKECRRNQWWVRSAARHRNDAAVVWLMTSLLSAGLRTWQCPSPPGLAVSQKGEVSLGPGQWHAGGVFGGPTVTARLRSSVTGRRADEGPGGQALWIHGELGGPLACGATGVWYSPQNGGPRCKNGILWVITQESTLAFRDEQWTDGSNGSLCRVCAARC